MTNTAQETLKKLAMPTALAGVWLFFIYMLDRDALLSSEGRLSFIGPRNLTQLLIEYSIVATLALGMFMVILTGHIDLSVGSGVGLIGGLAAVLITQKAWSAPLGLAAATGCALLLWLVIGALVVKQKVPSFIATLGGLLIFKGLFWMIIDNSTVPVTPGVDDNLYSLLTTYYLPKNIGLGLGIAVIVVFYLLHWQSRRRRLAYHLPVAKGPIYWLKREGIALAIIGMVLICNQFRGIPLSFLIMASAALLVYFITDHTSLGRHLYAIGGNEEAAVFSGINVGRCVIGAFVLMGLAVAATGFMVTAYAGASTTTVGDLMELDAIAACVIGGASLKGGRGTVGGVLLGALIMTSLLNGMTLMAVSPELKFIARGAVLAIAVWMDVKFSRD